MNLAAPLPKHASDYESNWHDHEGETLVWVRCPVNSCRWLTQVAWPDLEAGSVNTCERCGYTWEIEEE